jgi:hypothetical protein
MTVLIFRTGDIGMTAVVLGYTGIIGGLIGLATMLVFTPVAWLLGRALVRVRFIAVHILAFTTFGVGVGLAVVLLYIASGAHTRGLFTSGSAWTVMGASAISVVAGWANAACHAHRADASGGVYAWWTRAPRDQDAADEDRALGS